jgi:hypothetical protein
MPAGVPGKNRRVPTATPAGLFVSRIKAMTNKLFISALVACVSAGVGITVFSVYNDMGTNTAPSREQRQPTTAPESSLKREQRTDRKSKLSTKNTPLPKTNTVTAAPAPRPYLQSDLSVDIRHGEVTIRAENQSLKKVLDTLAHESGIQINSQLIRDRSLSIELVRVPLDRALQTILEFEDSFFAFASHGQSHVALKAVWVVPTGAGGQWPPQTPGCTRDLSEIEQQLASLHPNQRAEAIETLIDLRGPDAAQAVVQSLEDQDDDVRYRALQKAYRAGVVLPPEVLGELIERDRSELVRMMAVEAVGNHPSIDAHDKAALARYAINDGSPAVQTRASELLSHLESAPLIREQDEWLYDEAHQEQSAEFWDKNMGEQAK